MNKYQMLGLICLLVLVAALPFYALREAGRMEQAQGALTRQFVADGSEMYIENCVDCHGSLGEGIGAMPALNNPNLVKADYNLLYQTIAHAPHGTIMSAWHISEGGPLSSYEVEGLVTLIMSADWSRVAALSEERGLVVAPPPVPELEMATMEGTSQDPHECRACHEEPAIHADRFGLNCSRCHTLQAWKPAQLTRHTFLLDHGGQGKVSCQTCHTVNYATNTCYECHDHDPADMEVAHLQEEITELENCAECHPTGISGEAASLGYGLSGQARTDGSPGLISATVGTDSTNAVQGEQGPAQDPATPQGSVEPHDTGRGGGQ